MRVLALAHQWIPEHNAGAEVMLHGMLRALAARGHEVTVQLSRQEGPRYELDGVLVRPVPEPTTSDLISGVDVIVTHLENTPRATFLGKWHQIPVVQVLHNTMPITRSWLVREPIALAVHNSLWMKADYTAWCEANGHQLPPSIVCRPPVFAADYATTPGDRITLINLRPDEPTRDGVVLGKGAELFWELARALPDLTFLGVKGAYGEQLVYDLPNVEVLEHVPHDQMRERVYARTRVLLMPSSYESWGRTAIEAMASGIPVVYHPTPGLTEAVGPAGLRVDRTNLNNWRHALACLSNPRMYDDLSDFARARAVALDPTDDLNQWCDAIESLA